MFIILIFIGYMFSRRGLLTPEFNKCASKLLICIFVPASILNSVLSGRPQLSSGELWKDMGIIILMTLIGYVIAFAYSRIRKQDDKSPQVEMLMAVTNTLFVGMPILNAAFGTRTDFYVGMSCVPFNIILYSYGIWRLKKGRGGASLRDIINPCLIAGMLTLVVFVSNISIPPAVGSVVGTVSAVTVPLSMIVIGSTMGRCNPVSELKNPETWIFSFTRLVLTTLITYFVTKALTDDVYLIAACTILAGCPTGIVMTALSLQYGYDAEYSSKIITITTLLSIIVLPAFLMLLF